MKKINKSPLKAQKGFTLIELVVVIVILGILAATAAPKFIDLTGDARAATLQAVRASVESATAMAHAKALVSSTEDGTLDILGTDTVATDDLTFVNSWPAATTATWANLLDVEVGDGAPFRVVAIGTSIYWYIGSELTTATGVTDGECYVVYPQGTNPNIKPAIVIDTDKC